MADLSRRHTAPAVASLMRAPAGIPDLGLRAPLFAGNDVDATFANPIDDVLSALKVNLVF